MKLFPEKDMGEDEYSKQVELSEEQYEEMFGNSGIEAFYGFEDEDKERPTYTVYHFTSAPFETISSHTQDRYLNNGDDF